MAFDKLQIDTTGIIVQLLVEINPQHFIEAQNLDRFSLLSFWYHFWLRISACMLKAQYSKASMAFDTPHTAATTHHCSITCRDRPSTLFSRHKVLIDSVRQACDMTCGRRISARISQVQYIKASLAFDKLQTDTLGIIVQLLVEIDPQHFIRGTKSWSI